MSGEMGPGHLVSFRILETASFPMDGINEADSGRVWFTLSVRTLPGEKKEKLSGFFLGVSMLMMGILPVQLNDSRVLRPDLFVNGS